MRGKLCRRQCFAAFCRITPAGAGKTVCTGPNKATFRDHPRRCGENPRRPAAHDFRGGSPPQVRGKPKSAPCPRTPRGITPAGAGKTTFFGISTASLPDHPRRCGENVYVFPCVRNKPGSPPQVRGKPKSNLHCSSTCRITPAGAGKTAACSADLTKRQDHPRRCGENVIKVPIRNGSPGSPPQVRGKRSYRRKKDIRAGITPAGAGKTPLVRHLAGGGRDHPRRCGENTNPYCRMDSATGSPPQVRGKPLWMPSGRLNRRITPAGAGKTAFGCIPQAAARDHPRRCGENLQLLLQPQLPPGSPPQVRGKPAMPRARPTAEGITPAGAGKTRDNQHPPPARQDHPRRCGENGCGPVRLPRRMGSPPQVRGKPMQNTLRNAAIRITPAGAGKTLPAAQTPFQFRDHPRRCGEN